MDKEHPQVNPNLIVCLTQITLVGERCWTEHVLYARDMEGVNGWCQIKITLYDFLFLLKKQTFQSLVTVSQDKFLLVITSGIGKAYKNS